MTESDTVALVREMFSATNRAAETGRLDEWLSLFSENMFGRRPRMRRMPVPTKRMKAFAGTFTTGCRRSMNSDSNPAR
jgi:predicted RecB family endonuclease